MRPAELSRRSLWMFALGLCLAAAATSSGEAAAGDAMSPEVRLNRLYTSHFVLFYPEGVTERDANRVADRLELVYEAAGQRFAYLPKEPFPVVLYSARSFHAATVSPAWAAGLFDGTIRLPVGERGRIADSLLIHEYVHAIVHRMTRGRVPAWLSEGLALYLDGSPTPAPAQGPAGEGLPLTRLHADLTALSLPLAREAYDTSHEATRQLIARYGMPRVRLLLRRLADAPSFADAFERVFGERYAEFERHWTPGLER